MNKYLKQDKSNCRNEFKVLVYCKLSKSESGWIVVEPAGRQKDSVLIH